MFKTKINKTILLLFVIIAILHIIAIVDESPENEIRYNPRYSIWFVLIGLFYCTRKITFTAKNVLVQYLFIPVRRISADRINSIEFVMQKGTPYLVVCIDGYPPIAESYKKLKIFMASPKIIVSLIPEKERKEYIEEITQLYSDVSFVNWESTTH